MANERSLEQILPPRFAKVFPSTDTCISLGRRPIIMEPLLALKFLYILRVLGSINLKIYQIYEDKL